MNAEEALKICRLAKAASPAQAVDEYTPDLWAMVLEPYRFVDARDVIVQLASQQEWIHVSHVVKGIKKLRGERILNYGALPEPPSGLSDQAWAAWQTDMYRRIGDGEEVPKNTPELPSPEHVKRLAELTRNAFHAVPDADEPGGTE